MGLLSSVSKYYKMSFDKNVLIYVQRPNAALIATKMGWEKQTGRYLKVGSKGIGVVDMNNPKATLAYYFDLADTRGDYEGFLKAIGKRFNRINFFCMYCDFFFWPGEGVNLRPP